MTLSTVSTTMAHASKQFRGTAILVLAAIAALPVEHAAEAEKEGTDPAIVAKHAKQFAICATEATPAIAALPEDAQLEVNFWGIAGAESSDQGKFGWNLIVADRPTPIDEEGEPVEG